MDKLKILFCEIIFTLSLFLAVLLIVIENITFIPILNPITNPENLHFAVCCRADYTIEAGINNHFLADETGESVYWGIFSVNSAVDVNVASKQADASSGSVDDGILLGVNASTQFIPLAMGDVKLVSKAVPVFEAVLGFSWSSYITC